MADKATTVHPPLMTNEFELTKPQLKRPLSEAVP